MKKVETDEGLFFRYQKIDSYTKDNLKKNVLYFNDPENFNDPFDSKIDIIHQGSKEDWIKFFLRYNIDPKEINQLIREKKIIKRKNILKLARTKMNNKLREELFEKSIYRICCFSKTKLNICICLAQTQFLP